MAKPEADAQRKASKRWREMVQPSPRTLQAQRLADNSWEQKTKVNTGGIATFRCQLDTLRKREPPLRK